MTRILPPVAVLELTYRCNHACRFCSCPWFGGMMTPTQEMDVTEWKRLIAAYAEIGVTQFSFTGGEALMKEGCLELLDFAAALLAGADSVLLNRFLPGGRGLSHSELLLTPEEVVEAADIAEAVLKRAKRYGHFGTEMPLCLIDPKKYEFLNVTTGCSAAVARPRGSSVARPLPPTPFARR